MRPLMSRPQVLYYQRRLQVLLSDTAIAKRLGVSNMTLNRWFSGEYNPPATTEDDLRYILKEEVAKLHKRRRETRDEFYGDLADCITAAKPPEYAEPARPADDLGKLSDLIVSKCMGTKCSSTEIFKAALGLGFTKMQVYHMADKLGVIRRHVKKGRAGYSEWIMSKRARK